MSPRTRIRRLRRQGVAGVAVVGPVRSPGGEFAGAVSLTFSPQALVASRANASRAQAPVSFIVARPDGALLYHANATLSGASTLDDPVFREFPGVLDLARRHGAERAGYANFSFDREGSAEVVRKEACRETVSLHGTGWRVLAVAEADEPSPSTGGIGTSAPWRTGGARAVRPPAGGRATRARSQ